MTEKLDLAISNYKVISAITKKAQTLTLSNDKYVSEFNLPDFSKNYKNSKNEIETYFDNLNDRILEYAYLELFAGFEATVIEKIKLASGEMSKTIKENYNNSFPFVNYEKKFVKNADDLSSLNKILDLLKNKINDKLYEGLEDIVKYRDKLAHGKRFHENVALDSIESTYDIMIEILDEI